MIQPVSLMSKARLSTHPLSGSISVLRSMASVDNKDTTSVDLPVPDYETALGEGLKGLRIGIPKEYRMDGMPPEIEALWE